MIEDEDNENIMGAYLMSCLVDSSCDESLMQSFNAAVVGRLQYRSLHCGCCHPLHHCCGPSECVCSFSNQISTA